MADFNEQEGHWVTTKSGKHIFISEDLVGKRDREIKEQEEYTKKLNAEHTSGVMSELYSDVESRVTAVSEDDIFQLSGRYNPTAGYFQTPASWYINEALRDEADSGLDFDTALRNRGVVDAERRNNMKKTVKLMDKNMKPLNADVNTVRLVDNGYFNRLVQGLGLSKDTLKKLDSDIFMGRVKNGDEFKQFRDSVVGAKVYENGYISTCLDPKLKNLRESIKRGKHIRLEITASKGTKAMFSPTKEEDELVIDRHVPYTITDVSVRNGDLIIKAKI